MSLDTVVVVGGIIFWLSALIYAYVFGPKPHSTGGKGWHSKGFVHGDSDWGYEYLGGIAGLTEDVMKELVKHPGVRIDVNKEHK